MTRVEVNEGVLEGELKENIYGPKYYSFKGIPYAEPPVGDLRFKAPRPSKPWSGIRSAKEHGPICYQYDNITKAPPSGSEDCLYLNVYTPELQPTQPLPVMVFIHGGAFVSGSGNDDKYGPEFIISKGVILVTINYRVEALGFLCLETEDIPGNAGMKDQVAALRWINKNIKNFGGDPDNVTIFGESAGAASVTYHLLSPMTKGLFRRAIAQSGTATCWWSLAFEPRERAIALAKKLGCDSEDDKVLAEFFKSQPKESLIRVQVPITLSEVAKESYYIQFGIVDEKQFGDNERYFFGDVYDAVCSGIHDGVEVIVGYCEHEGLLGLAGVDVDKMIMQANQFREYLVPKPISFNCTMTDKFEAGRKIKNFYFKNEIVSTENLEQLVKYYGSVMFMYGVILWEKICASTGKSNQYLYKFTCKSERNILGHVFRLGEIIGKRTAVCHADDLGYMFNMKYLTTVEKESTIYNMINNVVTLWTNFAKCGNPTPDASLGVQWAPYTQDRQDYLDIGQELVPRTFPDQEEMEFWEDLFRRYNPKMVAH